MKYFMIFLVLLALPVIIPTAFGNCISLPCDDSGMKLGEPNYRFIDFSYANTFEDSIKFILEKTAYGHCTSFNAEITDEDGNLVWGEKSFALCDSITSPSLITSQIKIGYNEDNPIIINKSGKYFIKVQIDDGSIEREFVVRQNHSGISLDRLGYPVPWELSPLKQFNAGVPFDEIQCKDELTLIQKYDGSPTCVTEQTKQKLIERGWAKENKTILTFDYIIKKDDVTFGSQYQISGGIVDAITYNKNSNSLIIALSESDKGYIQIIIQTGILHQHRQLPFDYFVLVDGEEVSFEQFSPIILKIPFEKGVQQIEVIGVNNT
ncbi:hypothetical protein [Nitrosopumilus sp.]|uniref:hypothetical protein n=1 Tax=Nitrosopumilus sp. TaxID=2024843 RepID=UPI0034A04BE1